MMTLQINQDDVTLMYDHDMGRMRGEPKGAALTTPNDWEEFPASGSTTG